jgi:predicted aspartyl protease
VANPVDGTQFTEQEMVVDAGAHMSVLPRALLEKLGIRPYVRRTFVLANGMRIERDVGLAVFTYGQFVGGSPVIFGEADDKALLGVLTLEALGLTIDPVKGELKPIELLLL